MIKQYKINYSHMTEQFLISKGIRYFVTDADIIGFSINNVIIELLNLELIQYRKDNQNNMAINPTGDGLLYHN